MKDKDNKTQKNNDNETNEVNNAKTQSCDDTKDLIVQGSLLKDSLDVEKLLNNSPSIPDNTSWNYRIGEGLKLSAIMPVEAEFSKVLKAINTPPWQDSLYKSFELPKFATWSDTLSEAIKLPETTTWFQSLNSASEIINVTEPAFKLADTFSSLQPNYSISTSVLDACTAGLSTYKYVLDTADFQPTIQIPEWQKTLTDITSALSASIPNLTQTINLPKINALEYETASLLKNSGLDISMPLSSLSLTNTLNSLTTVSSELLPKIDAVLSATQILGDYSSLMQKQYGKLQKNICDYEKPLKVVDIATNVVESQIASACSYVDNWDEESEVKSHSLQVSNSKTSIQYIPVYLGYALKDDSEYNLEEEFDKSIIGKILVLGKSIAEKIKYINEINTEENVFKPTNASFTAISCISTAFSVDKDTFANVVDSLYMLLYEGSGYAARILKILKDEECATLWNIKHLRTDFRHDYEHGKEREIRNKKKLIADAYQKTCGMKKPIRQKEWVSAHHNLFMAVDEFLDLIIDRYNEKEVILE